MNITASNFLFGVWMCVIYIVKQNVKVSSSYVYRRLYFTHKLKNPIINSYYVKKKYT